MNQPTNLPLEDEPKDEFGNISVYDEFGNIVDNGPKPRQLPNRRTTNYIVEQFNEGTQKWEFLLKTKKGRIAENELFDPYTKRRMRIQKS